MRLTKEVIGNIEKDHSEIGYYFLIIEVIESNINVNPDICIESCKSLLEGISKFILKKLDSTYDVKLIDGLDFHQLFKKSISKLAEHSPNLEADFIQRMVSLMHVLGHIRSKRGDISHGRLSPKELKSDLLFSNLVMEITDSLACYKLKCFSDVKLIKQIKYEDYTNFNEWLDSINQMGSLSYSKALYDQELKTYKQELFDYLDTYGLSDE